MLKICGARHDPIWYHAPEVGRLDCPLCATLELLEKHTEGSMNQKTPPVVLVGMKKGEEENQSKRR